MGRGAPPLGVFAAKSQILWRQSTVERELSERERERERRVGVFETKNACACACVQEHVSR